MLVVSFDKPWTKQQQRVPNITSPPINEEAEGRSTSLEVDHVLCACVTEYLDEEKQEKGITEKRGGAKKQKWSGKENRGPKKRR